MLRLTLVATALFLPALALADGPVERRLHPDRVDASSFLWNDLNKFQENYHPSYLGDDDAKTAWVEGAENSGAGEWIKVAVTNLDGTSRVRLSLRNGYQKSKGLFKANARAKEVTLKLLPSGVEKKVTLGDAEGWQDVVVEQPPGPFEGIELAIGSVYEGTRYTDLCLSDLQVFVTSTTKENPAFEKSKQQKILAWKAERVRAAKAFQEAAKHEPLPILPAYRWEAKDVEAANEVWHTCKQNWGCWATEVQKLIAKNDPGLATRHKDALLIAAAGLKDGKGFVAAKLAPKGDDVLPEVDGLHEPTMYDRYEYVVGYAGLEVPMLGTIAGLRADRMGAFEVKSTVSISDIAGATDPSCRKDNEEVHTWMLKDKVDGRDTVRAMIFARCGKFETRDGEDTAGMMQVAVYDKQGRLEVLAGEGYVNVFTWKDATLASGKGIFFDGRIGELTGPEIAKNP
jgi:hypothetical protein